MTTLELAGMWVGLGAKGEQPGCCGLIKRSPRSADGSSGARSVPAVVMRPGAVAGRDGPQGRGRARAGSAVGVAPSSTIYLTRLCPPGLEGGGYTSHM